MKGTMRTLVYKKLRYTFNKICLFLVVVTFVAAYITPNNNNAVYIVIHCLCKHIIQYFLSCMSISLLYTIFEAMLVITDCTRHTCVYLFG